MHPELLLIMRATGQQLLDCHGAARPVSVAVYGYNLIPPVKPCARGSIESSDALDRAPQAKAIAEHKTQGRDAVRMVGTSLGPPTESFKKSVVAVSGVTANIRLLYCGVSVTA